MGRSKIQDEAEVIRWIEEGRTYSWMSREYLSKYNIEVTPSTFSNFRARKGMDRRITRDEKLIPWQVLPEHRYDYPIMNLRLEARHRAGFPVTEEQAHQIKVWKDGLRQDGLVIHYEPATEQGWFYVPRREGVDLDLIREPDERPRVMRLM